MARAFSIVPGEEAEPLPDSFGRGAQFVRLGQWQVRTTMASPKIEPRLEMTFLEPQWKMFLWHRPVITQGPAGHARPKIRDLFQVGGPVADLRTKDRTDFVVLTNIGVKMSQKMTQPRPSTQSNKERFR